MRQCLVARIPFLLAFILLPACVALSEDPSAGDPSAADPSAVTTDDEALAITEANAAANDPRQEAPSLAAPEASAVVIAAATDCPTGRLCLWDGAGCTGRMVSFPPRGRCENLDPYGMNDKTSCWFNHTNGYCRVYRDPGCQGPRFTIYPGQRSGQMDSYWNNEFSSICCGAGCPSPRPPSGSLRQHEAPVSARIPAA